MDGPEMPGSPDLASQTDALLVERAIDGDVDAFEVLVRRHGPMVHAYARRLTGAGVDAEDITQEALLQAWRQLSSLRDAAALRGWLLSITSRCSMDLLRRRRSAPTPKDLEPGTIDDSPAPESSAVTACLLDALSEALHRLPDRQRQCWVLREIGGQSYQEIAVIQTSSIPSVRGNLSRARAALLKEMEEWR